jgi:hypothetical protein
VRYLSLDLDHFFDLDLTKKQLYTYISSIQPSRYQPKMDTSTSTQTSAMSSTQQSPSIKSLVPPAPAPVKAPSTDAFLKDFTLVAEAAKRAQMAVLMRDFESVGLK